jgi:hypothetical protein
MFDFLDHLRQSGVTNMFGAGPYLQEQFDIDRHQAREVVLDWMENFGKQQGEQP